MSTRMMAWGGMGLLGLLLVMPDCGRAQSSPALDAAPAERAALPPSNGALPPAEILVGVRAAGFDPLSRPRLRGPVYVLFATDRYLRDVRLTVDARSGRVLAATRLAGAAYGGPVYEGNETQPRALPPGYVAGGPRYEPAPVPPGEIPLQRQRPPAEVTPRSIWRSDAKRAAPAPLPRARPDDTATSDVKAPGPPVEANFPTTAPAAVPANAKPDQPPRLTTPAMVPVAPLE